MGTQCRNVLVPVLYTLGGHTQSEAEAGGHESVIPHGVSLSAVEGEDGVVADPHAHVEPADRDGRRTGADPAAPRVFRPSGFVLL